MISTCNTRKSNGVGFIFGELESFPSSLFCSLDLHHITSLVKEYWLAIDLFSVVGSF